MRNFIVVLLIGLFGFGCASLERNNREPLKVGITPNYPPMIFMQDGKVSGLEADLMRKLGRALNRPVKVMSLPWEEQMDALLAGDIDLIMSGMSITEARKVKIGFTDPWMKSGLLAMTRKPEAAAIPTAEQVRRFRGSIGVLAGTTSETWVEKNCTLARVVRIASPADAVLQLQNYRIDLFIHDIPSVVWQVASNEAQLGVLLEPLDREDIAWGVRRNDTELTAQLNALIQEWRADGSLTAAIEQWIPYYGRLQP